MTKEARAANVRPYTDGESGLPRRKAPRNDRTGGGKTKTPSVIPQDRSITLNIKNAAAFPDFYRAIFGLPPLKWWQRLYIRLRWGRKIRKAQFVAARGLTKTRMTCKMMLGVDPFDEMEPMEEQYAEEEN